MRNGMRILMTDHGKIYVPPPEAYAAAKTRQACPECYAPIAPVPAHAKEGRCASHRPRPKTRYHRQIEPAPEDNYAYV